MEEVYKGASREVRLWPSWHGKVECYPLPTDKPAFRKHLRDEGFIVVRNAVPKALCRMALELFRTQIKRSKYPFLRHEEDIFEPHIFTDAGHMKFPILNIQDIPDFRFRRSKRAILDALTHASIQQAIEAAFDEPGQIVQTMLFEGNQNTWPHRDGRYVDSEEKGQLLGTILAAEDIDPGAGRFYICARSNVTPIPGEEQGPSANPNGSEYKRLISDFVANGPLECVAPILTQGDVVIWSSMTIHGSLATSQPAFSRATLNAHWVPKTQGIRLMGGKTHHPRVVNINGVNVAKFGGQYGSANKLKSTLKSAMPGLVPLVRAARARLRGGRD